MYRIYFKEEVCIACHLCEVYCCLEHSQSRDLIRKQTPGSLSRLSVEEKGHVSLSVRCQHCDEAPCVFACLTGALTRDAVTGVIKVDEERCIGCWTCLLFCPIGAIRQDRNKNKALKCDLCQGENIPVCVANCPNEALVYAEEQSESSNLGIRSVSPVR